MNEFGWKSASLPERPLAIKHVVLSWVRTLLLFALSLHFKIASLGSFCLDHIEWHLLTDCVG